MLNTKSYFLMENLDFEILPPPQENYASLQNFLATPLRHRVQLSSEWQSGGVAKVRGEWQSGGGDKKNEKWQSGWVETRITEWQSEGGSKRRGMAIRRGGNSKRNGNQGLAIGREE